MKTGKFTALIEGVDYKTIPLSEAEGGPGFIKVHLTDRSAEDWNERFKEATQEFTQRGGQGPLQNER